MNPRLEWFGLILIENSVWIDSDWKLVFELVRIYLDSCLRLNRIKSDRFLPFFIKRDTKHFSDWFGIIRISSNRDIGMNRNSSDWLGINFNLILSPGLLTEAHSSSFILLMLSRQNYAQFLIWSTLLLNYVPLNTGRMNIPRILYFLKFIWPKFM